MKKIILVLALITLTLILFVGCNNSGSDKKSDNTSNISTKVALPTKDMAGNDIKIPTEIKTIASISPSITQVLVDLGLGDKIVAIDVNAKGMKGINSKAIVVDMMNPDIEQLVALKPDIVFTSGMSMADGKNPFQPLTDMGICMANIPSSKSIENIKKDIMFIANATRTSEKGKKIVDNMQKEIDAISQIGKTIQDKKKVYFEIAPSPSIYSFGSDVFLNEMIDIIGAKNVFADKSGWISVSDEAVIKKNPDVIYTNVTHVKDPAKEIRERKGWSEINAVKNNNVYYVDKFASSLPNHNIVKALKEMAKAVYPDKY